VRLATTDVQFAGLSHHLRRFVEPGRAETIAGLCTFGKNVSRPMCAPDTVLKDSNNHMCSVTDVLFLPNWRHDQPRARQHPPQSPATGDDSGAELSNYGPRRRRI